MSIGDTDIYIHPAMLVYALYAVITGHGLFMGIATFSILLHEASHAFVSAAFGQTPTQVELIPLGAVMHIEDDGKLPRIRRILMLLAGPAMTLVLCLLSMRLTSIGTISRSIGRLIFISNLSILFMNLLPVLPLDGGRILSTILEAFLPTRKVFRILQCVGGIVGAGLILLNVYVSWKLGGWNLSLAFAGCCVLYSTAVSTTTVAITELRQFMDRKIMLERKGHFPAIQICALHNTPLRKLVRMLPPNKLVDFCCIEIGTMKKMGIMFESDVIQHYLSTPNLTFGEAMLLSQNQSSSANSDTI